MASPVCLLLACSILRDHVAGEHRPTACVLLRGLTGWVLQYDQQTKALLAAGVCSLIRLHNRTMLSHSVAEQCLQVSIVQYDLLGCGDSLKPCPASRQGRLSCYNPEAAYLDLVAVLEQFVINQVSRPLALPCCMPWHLGTPAPHCCRPSTPTCLDLISSLLHVSATHDPSTLWCCAELGWRTGGRAQLWSPTGHQTGCRAPQAHCWPGCARPWIPCKPAEFSQVSAWGGIVCPVPACPIFTHSWLRTLCNQQDPRHL